MTDEAGNLLLWRARLLALRVELTLASAMSADRGSRLRLCAEAIRRRLGADTVQIWGPTDAAGLVELDGQADTDRASSSIRHAVTRPLTDVLRLPPGPDFAAFEARALVTGEVTHGVLITGFREDPPREISYLIDSVATLLARYMADHDRSIQACRPADTEPGAQAA